VSHDGVVPDDLDRHVGPFERLEGALSRHHPVDEIARRTFDLLLVDLPLAWRGFSRKGEGRSPQRHYDTMDIPALCRLGEKVASLKADGAVAASWVYGPRLGGHQKVRAPRRAPGTVRVRNRDIR
jgi:hypothetical protein